MINATQILSIVHLPSCSPACSQIPTTHQTVESKFIIKSINNRVQNAAHHQNSINSSIIRSASGNKFPKSGRRRSVRENSTLPPKPRAEGSNPSAPAIVTEAFKRLHPPNAPIFVNIPTAAVWYIIKKASADFRKRTVLYRVPRMILVGKRNASFLFNLVVLIKTDDMLDCGCRT